MKAITVNVSEPVYADFQRFAEQKDCPASELIREAMEAYRQARIHPQRSLRDSRPASIQSVLKPWGGRSELLDDLLE